MTDRRRASKEEQEEWLLLTLKRLYDLPLSSARDLAGYGDLSESQLEDLLDDATRRDFAGCIRVGQTFRIQRRVYLHRKGLHRLRERFGLPITWQVTEPALQWHVRRLRLYEPVNRLVPCLFRSGAVRTPASFAMEPGDDPQELVLDEHVTLEAFTWVRDILRSPVHAIAQYRTAGGDPLWVPIVCVGLHHGDIPGPDDLHEVFADVDTMPDFQYALTPAAPLGVIFVVLDRLAGLAVRLRVPPHLPIAIVDAEGHVIRQMDPAAPAGRVLDPSDDPGPLGQPERTREWLDRQPHLLALQGVTKRKLFERVNSFAGSPKKDLASGIGHPPSKVGKILKTFRNTDLVAILGRRPYLEHRGRVAAARRDRQNPNAVHARLGAYTRPGSPYREQQRDHDRGVAKLAALFRRAGMQAEAGWRLEIIEPSFQIRPDLWVLIPAGDGSAMWHAVEYERSALADSQVHRKLGPYRTAMDEGQIWPMLMVCGRGTRSERGRAEDWAAARRYMDAGDDLPMLVMPTHRAFSGDLVAPGARWHRRGGPVPITQLMQEVDWPTLRERIDTPVCWD